MNFRCVFVIRLQCFRVIRLKDKRILGWLQYEHLKPAMSFVFVLLRCGTAYVHIAGTSAFAPKLPFIGRHPARGPILNGLLTATDMNVIKCLQCKAKWRMSSLFLVMVSAVVFARREKTRKHSFDGNETALLRCQSLTAIKKIGRYCYRTTCRPLEMWCGLTHNIH